MKNIMTDDAIRAECLELSVRIFETEFCNRNNIVIKSPEKKVILQAEALFQYIKNGKINHDPCI